MKVFIIGGTRLVGPHVVRELESSGHQTTCFNRSGTRPGGGIALKGDRDDETALRSAISDTAPDLVIDMIPYTEVQAISLGRILETRGCPLVACSSIDVYRAFNILKGIEEPPYQKCPIRESDALRSTLSIDGKRYDKLNVEGQYLSLDVDVTILRLPAIYGWPDTSRISGYVDQISSAGRVTMHPLAEDFRFSRALNRNCAFAVALAVAVAPSGKRVYNVAEPDCLTEVEWCRRIGAHLDWDGEITFDESAPIDADLRQDWMVDTSLIREELGFYEKYDPEEGLRENIRQHMAAGE